MPLASGSSHRSGKLILVAMTCSAGSTRGSRRLRIVLRVIRRGPLQRRVSHPRLPGPPSSFWQACARDRSRARSGVRGTDPSWRPLDRARLDRRIHRSRGYPARVEGTALRDDWHGSATHIPADDASFDLVFSHGVLHHIPDIAAAQKIHRVLRPGGRLVAMLYARRSLNYLVAIAVLRRAAILAAWPVRDRVKGGLLGAHLRNAESEGLSNYLRLERFTHASTDGPDSPSPACMTKRAFEGTSPPSGSSGRTRSSCTRLPCLSTGFPAPAWLAGTSGSNLSRGDAHPQARTRLSRGVLAPGTAAAADSICRSHKGS